MKKTTIIKALLSVGCLITLCGAIEANAEEPVIRNNYIDEDGDGICDNRNEKGYRYVDENNDGICDNRTVQCSGTGYQDGICSHLGSERRHRHGRN